jgi:hypothetical protein
MIEMPDEILDTLIAHELAHTVINRQLFGNQLPPEDQVTYEQAGRSARVHADLARQLTDWSDATADSWTLRWNPRLKCMRLREWANGYLRNLSYSV